MNTQIQPYGCGVTKQSVVPKIFDPSKLEAMSEPLAVRVEKLKGNTRFPIPLPAGAGGVPQGTEWSKDDVRGVEQWLVNEWSGGGMYAIIVTDSSVPTPQKHDWTIFYNPADYPEKVPPTLSAAAAEPRPAPSPSSPLQQVRNMAQYPSAFPGGLPSGIAAPVGQPTMVYAPQPTYYPQTAYQAPRTDLQGSNHLALDTERRRHEEQLREMQSQLTRQREEMLQAQFRQELDRKLTEAKQEQAANNERFSRMEQLMEKVIAASTAKPANDPAIEALKEQNRVLAAQAESERREREAERRERDMKDAIQRQSEDTRRQFETMNAQMVAQQLAASTNKSDPMMMVLQENARQQVEAGREQARNQLAAMQQLQTFMMNPRDIMAMTKESSNGLDQVTRQITGAFTDVFNMQRAAVDQILQLQGGGGSETIQLVEKGLDRVSSFAERFIGGKTREAVSQQQSQAQLAQANAAAMQAQAQAMATQASMQARAARTADSGLNGAPQVPAVSGPSGETKVEQTSSAQPTMAPPDGWTTGPVSPAVPPVPVRKVRGFTDEAWFGPILPKVVELRAGTERFIDSLKQAPPRLNKDGSVDGVEPEQAAAAILQAAMYVMENQIPIQAMIDLLGQGRVADFMDVLLPDAPQPYRDEVAQLVLIQLQGGDPNDDDDDDDDGDDDDDDGDENDGNDAKLDHQSAKPTRPTPRARA